MKVNPSKSLFWSFLTAVLILSVATVLLSSCVLTKKQQDRFLRDYCITASVTKEKDSTHIEEKVRIDTFYKSITGPTVYLPSPCDLLCDSSHKLKPFKQVSRKNGITQSLQSIGNVLVQNCDVDSLLEVSKELTKTIDHYKTIEKETQIHTDCKLPHLTDSYVFWAKLGKILSIAWIIYIALRVLKTYFKTVPWLSWLSKFII